MQQIGIGHPLIKRVRDIQRNATRNRDRQFVADGLWAHQVLIQAGTPIETFFWCPEAGHSREAEQLSTVVAGRAYRSYQVSARTLARISERDEPDGLVSIARLPSWQPAQVAARLGPSALILVADGIEIPGNLGTIIRTLDACRGDALVLCNRRTRLTHPKVFRGSHGACVTIPVVEFDKVDELMDWLATNGFQVWLTQATAASLNYRQVTFSGRVAIVVGNERYGLSSHWDGYDLPRIAVPMLGRGDSLNVAVASSILLYEARAQLEGWSAPHSSPGQATLTP